MMMEDQEKIAQLRERLAQAEALLKRVVDKEQAKREMQGLTIFRSPNSLLDAIQAFLKDEQQG